MKKYYEFDGFGTGGGLPKTKQILSKEEIFDKYKLPLYDDGLKEAILNAMGEYAASLESQVSGYRVITEQLTKRRDELIASQQSVRWVKASENWDDVILRGRPIRDAETKYPIPYREVAKCESFGNKWINCWVSQWDIKSYPAERVEYLDESASPEAADDKDKEIERLKDGLRDCDALLAYFEDFTHGQDGGRITKERYSISKLI